MTGKQITLPDGFVVRPELMAGNTRSGHGVIFGSMDGEVVALKPFANGSTTEQRINRARHEHSMYGRIRNLGHATLDSLGVVQAKDSVFLRSRHQPGLVTTASLPMDHLELRVEPGVIQPNVYFAVESIAQAIARLHQERITHGDAKPRNFSFRKLDAFGPYVVDLERTQVHTTGTKADEFFGNALRKDLSKFAHDLGSNGYGGRDPVDASAVLERTFTEPYAQTAPGQMSLDLAQHISESFERGRVVHQRQMNDTVSSEH